ncbi:MAG: O-antigen ligase family protein [Flavobacteriales bacterium]
MLRHIHVILLSLLALAIPIYQVGILSLFILLLSVLSIIRINRNRKVAWGTVCLTGLGVFILLGLSLLWSEDVHLGLKNLETKLSLCLLPLIIGTSEPLNRKEYGIIKGCFLLGIIITMLIRLVNAIIRTDGLNDLSAFYYVELSGVIHPSYLSLYIVCGIAMVLLDPKVKQPTLSGSLLNNGFVLLSIFFVVLLSSKAGLLSLILVLVAYLVNLIATRKKIAQKATAVVFILFMVGFTVISPTSVSRVKSLGITTQKKPVDTNNPINSSYRNTTAVRIIAWEMSLKIMNESPFGNGIGDGKNALLKEYAEQEEYYMLDKKYNSHNQFFEMGLSTGWLGLLCLVGCFLILFLRAVHLKDWVQVTILMVLVLNLLAESMLERQSGAVFIPFVLCLLAFREFSHSVRPKENSQISQ